MNDIIRKSQHLEQELELAGEIRSVVAVIVVIPSARIRHLPAVSGSASMWFFINVVSVM